MRKAIYQIIEHGSFIKDKEVDGYTTLPTATFDQLENFILYNKNKGAEALELMSISAKKGIGKIITAKNYIGLLTMQDGTTIEIMPKIYSRVLQDEQQMKKLIVDMLKTLEGSPYKTLQMADVGTAKINVIDVFIRMFVREVFLIVKHGLKNNYEMNIENLNVFKGKMLFPEQLKRNHTHKERSVVAYDLFNNNCPENRLIKSTLLNLYQITSSDRTKTDIRILLNAFDEVVPSSDFASDFKKIGMERRNREYATALLWCEIFLKRKSFTSFAGSEIAFALLYPMEMLFENYIAAQMKRELKSSDFSVSTQDRTYHLFTRPNEVFQIKPDMIVTRHSDQAVFVCDAKWKILADQKRNYGISQADMYQMYVYQKKYDAQSVTLIYPLTDEISNPHIDFQSDDGVTVHVRFVDLFDVRNCIAAIANEFKE